MSDHIPLEKCVHGRVYRLVSRNLLAGVYDAQKNSFTGVREKFRRRSLDMEYHWDNGAPHGTARPQEEIGECPIKNLAVLLETRCTNCRKEVKWKPNGGVGTTGKWFHIEEGGCEDADPVAVSKMPSTISRPDI